MPVAAGGGYQAWPDRIELMTEEQPEPQQPLVPAPEAAQVPQEPHAPVTPENAPQAAPNGVPQWIPATPPPNPYADGQRAAGQAGGKWIAITAMALGLVALLTVLVSVAYFNGVVLIVGGLLGIAAAALGVVALVKKSRPLGGGITGLATGALSMIAITILVSIGAVNGSVLASPGDDGATGTAEGEPWQPGTEQEALLGWPANMQSGGIVFTGPGDPRPAESEPLAAGSVPVPNQVDRGSRNDILIYVDYRCPHCGVFEQQNSEFLSKLIASGDTTVEVVPLSFMDRISEGSYYSSRAAAAVACFADSQPEAAWAAHQALLSAEVQPGAGKGLDNEQLLAALEQQAGPVNAEVQNCVTNEIFVPFAQSLNEWVFQNPVPNTLAENVRIEGTPTIVVNGAVYPGDPSDPAAFEAFFEGLAH